MSAPNPENQGQQHQDNQGQSSQWTNGELVGFIQRKPRGNRGPGSRTKQRHNRTAREREALILEIGSTGDHLPLPVALTPFALAELNRIRRSGGDA